MLGAISGASLGYGNLLGMTWIQSRIPRQLMGRVMSLLMVGSMGLIPVSQLIAGALVQISLEGLLAVSGLGMAVLTLAALGSARIRGLGLEPPLQAVPDPPVAGEQGDAAPRQTPASSSAR